jgi:hypothetical protein
MKVFTSIQDVTTPYYEGDHYYIVEDFHKMKTCAFVLQ